MCGIAGFVGQPLADAQDRLRALGDALAHRGPDGEGFLLRSFGTQQVGLAHRRLAIIDLATGQQPISNETGRVHVVFNGEIYNYRTLRIELERAGHVFRTASDTEVIVHAYEEYGAECVSYFRGMFAFAIWDEDREQLLLARDRFGEKPLFLLQQGESLVFASEMSALLAWPAVERRLDVRQLPGFLQYRYVPGPNTLIEGITKLLPGCVAVWRHGTLTQQRYYSPPDGVPLTRPVRGLDPVLSFRQLLEESVALMMVSDVPYGAFLSGGLDSSAIVALMSRQSRVAVRTYSVGFEESGFSELSFAGEVAAAFSTEHHELTITQRAVADLLPQAARLRDAPLAEPADIPIYLLAREARRTVKMVLTGEGSDEALGGYPKHAFERLSEGSRVRLPGFLRRSLVQPIAAALPYSARRVKTAMRALGESNFEARMPLWFGALTAGEVRLLTGEPSPLADAATAFPFQSDARASALRRMLYFDQTSWLPDNLLERGDRMTMAASLEARMPFLDHRLIEFVSSLPDRQRVRGRVGKRILRAAMRGVLPPRVLSRRKVGFRMPVHLWLQDGLRPMLFDLLLAPGAVLTPLLDRAQVRRFVEEHVAGRHNHEKLLWMLLNLEIWCRSNRIRV